VTDVRAEQHSKQSDTDRARVHDGPTGVEAFAKTVRLLRGAFEAACLAAAVAGSRRSMVDVSEGQEVQTGSSAVEIRDFYHLGICESDF
jgi:hypothetical protein